MRRDDFRYLDNKDRYEKDPDVLALTKRSLYAMSISLGVNTYTFKEPKPIDVLSYIENRLGHLFAYEEVKKSEKYEYVFLWYILGEQFIEDKAFYCSSRMLQRVSDLCYYLACNDVRLDCIFPITQDVLDEFTEQCRYEQHAKREGLLYFISQGDRLGIRFLSNKKTEETTTVSESPTVVDDSEIPIRLQKHLQKCSNMAEVVKEVCRIQMLGPKYRRADNALGALLNAWNIMDKE